MRNETYHGQQITTKENEKKWRNFLGPQLSTNSRDMAFDFKLILSKRMGQKQRTRRTPIATTNSRQRQMVSEQMKTK